MSIDEISQAYDISRNNLNKIVHQLGKAGVIHTQRGKGGGFCLNLTPKEINIGEIVSLLESSLQVVDCQTPVCRILPACQLKHVLAEATNAFLASLKQYTLADLIDDKRTELVSILSFPS